ncbi:MAG: hypothetical protein AAB359_02290 [Elusimicrobiota bacterium]
MINFTFGFSLNDAFGYSARGIQKIVRRVSTRAGITQEVSSLLKKPSFWIWTI